MLLPVQLYSVYAKRGGRRVKKTLSCYNPTTSWRPVRLAFQSPLPNPIGAEGCLKDNDPCALMWVPAAPRSPPCSCVRLRLVLLLCLLPMSYLILDMREKRLACQYHWSLEARKKPVRCMCWVFPAPVVISAIEEVTFRAEGYNDKADSSRAEDDINVFGHREWSRASFNYSSATGCSGRL